MFKKWELLVWYMKVFLHAFTIQLTSWRRIFLNRPAVYYKRYLRTHTRRERNRQIDKFQKIHDTMNQLLHERLCFFGLYQNVSRFRLFWGWVMYDLMKLGQNPLSHMDFLPPEDFHKPCKTFLCFLWHDVTSKGSQKTRESCHNMVLRFTLVNIWSAIRCFFSYNLPEKNENMGSQLVSSLVRPWWRTWCKIPWSSSHWTQWMITVMASRHWWKGKVRLADKIIMHLTLPKTNSSQTLIFRGEQLVSGSVGYLSRESSIFQDASRLVRLKTFLGGMICQWSFIRFAD